MREGFDHIRQEQDKKIIRPKNFSYIRQESENISDINHDKQSDDSEVGTLGSKIQTNLDNQTSLQLHTLAKDPENATKFLFERLDKIDELDDEIMEPLIKSIEGTGYIIDILLYKNIDKIKYKYTKALVHSLNMNIFNGIEKKLLPNLFPDLLQEEEIKFILDLATKVRSYNSKYECLKVLKSKYTGEQSKLPKEYVDSLRSRLLGYLTYKQTTDYEHEDTKANMYIEECLLHVDFFEFTYTEIKNLMESLAIELKPKNFRLPFISDAKVIYSIDRLKTVIMKCNPKILSIAQDVVRIALYESKKATKELYKSIEESKDLTKEEKAVKLQLLKDIASAENMGKLSLPGENLAGNLSIAEQEKISKKSKD